MEAQSEDRLAQARRGTPQALGQTSPQRWRVRLHCPGQRWQGQHLCCPCPALQIRDESPDGDLAAADLYRHWLEELPQLDRYRRFRECFLAAQWSGSSPAYPSLDREPAASFPNLHSGAEESATESRCEVRCAFGVLWRERGRIWQSDRRKQFVFARQVLLHLQSPG